MAGQRGQRRRFRDFDLVVPCQHREVIAEGRVLAAGAALNLLRGIEEEARVSLQTFGEARVKFRRAVMKLSTCNRTAGYAR